MGSFFTGGATLAIAAATGSTCSLTGAAVSIATALVDMIESKGYVKKLESLTCKIEQQAGELQRFVNAYKDSINFIETNFNLNSTASWTTINRFWVMFESSGHNILSNSERMGGALILFGTLFTLIKPCTADGGTLVLLAQEFTRQTFNSPVGVQVSEEVFKALSKSMAKTGVQESAKTGAQAVAKVATNVGLEAVAKTGTSAGNEALKTSSKEIAKEAIKIGDNVAAQVTATVLQGVAASVSIGFVIWDITSLIDSLKKGHVVVTNIDKALEQLNKVEEQIEEQLKVLTDVQVKTDASVKARVQVCTKVKCRRLEDEDEDEDSDEEDEKEIPLYDISPQLLKIGLRQLTTVSALPPVLNESDAIRRVESIINEWKSSNCSLETYLKLIDALEFLIERGATFARNDPVDSINFTFCTKTLSFDKTVRNTMQKTLIPLFESLKVRVLPSISCCIYRFHCVPCQIAGRAFNYVGQSRAFNTQRFKVHQKNIKKTSGIVTDYINYVVGMFRTNILQDANEDQDDGSKGISVLYKHEATSHIALRTLGHKEVIFEAFITHRLPEFNGTRGIDKSVRRSWEIYYQWLFKAMVSEGGGSQR